MRVTGTRDSLEEGRANKIGNVSGAGPAKRRRTCTSMHRSSSRRSVVGRMVEGQRRLPEGGERWLTVSWGNVKQVVAAAVMPVWRPIREEGKRAVGVSQGLGQELYRQTTEVAGGGGRGDRRTSRQQRKAGAGEDDSSRGRNEAWLELRVRVSRLYALAEHVLEGRKMGQMGRNCKTQCWSCMLQWITGERERWRRDVWMGETRRSAGIPGDKR